MSDRGIEHAISLLRAYSVDSNPHRRWTILRAVSLLLAEERRTSPEPLLDPGAIAEPPESRCGDRWRMLHKTSPSGKVLYSCSCCGRVSPTPDKACRTVEDPDESWGCSRMWWTWRTPDMKPHEPS